jgi:hypothetical protein
MSIKLSAINPNTMDLEVLGCDDYMSAAAG